MPKLLDANLIIRYLVNDDPKKSLAVEKLLKSKEELIITDVTISEIIWLLASYYKTKRKNIVEKIEALLILSNVKCDKKLLLLAVSLYKNHKIDWVDAYLSAYTLVNRLESIYSYDRDLDKIKNIKREEP